MPMLKKEVDRKGLRVILNSKTVIRVTYIFR